MFYRSIPNFEHYKINVIGDVKNQWGKLLTPHLNKVDGYLSVVLSKNNIQLNKTIHTLVADTFIPNPNNLPIVNHKDRNKLNNFVDNLERCTHAYNIKHGYFFTTLERYQLNYSDVLEMRNLRNFNYSITKLSQLFNLPTFVTEKLLSSEIFQTIL